MKISQKGLDLIKRFEGLKLQAYLCPANIPTIGFGHTGNVKLGDKITYEVAESLLKNDLIKFENEANKYGLNQNQFNAIVSFCYNCGIGNFDNSTLRKKIIANPEDGTIKDEFAKWTRGGGKVLPGLVKRRNEEANLYFEQ